MGVILRMFLMIPCEVLFRDHLSNVRRIDLLGIGRGLVVGRGDTI